MIIRSRSIWTGRHIRCTILCGPDEDHLVNTGTLVMEDYEWESFIVALEDGCNVNIGVSFISEGLKDGTDEQYE